MTLERHVKKHCNHNELICHFLTKQPPQIPPHIIMSIVHVSWAQTECQYIEK